MAKKQQTREDFLSDVNDAFYGAQREYEKTFGLVYDLNKKMRMMEDEGPDEDSLKEAKALAKKLGIELKFDVQKIDFDSEEGMNLEQFWEPSSSIC